MILLADRNKYHKLFYILIFFLLSSALPAQNVYSQKNKKILIRYLYSIDSFYNNKFGLPTGVFVDRILNEIYIIDNQKNEILIFNGDGTPVFKIDKKKGIKSPIDLVLSKGLMYVTQEGKNFIEVFDYRGDLVRRIIPPDNIKFIPGRLAIDENDNLYVINKTKTNCLVFNKKGELVNEIGSGLFSLASITIYNKRVYLITPFDGSAIQVFDKNGKIISLKEKPKKPKSNYAITGLYFYDNRVVSFAKKIKPSDRGELEITNINQMYLKAGDLDVKLFGRGFAWFDTGTVKSLINASDFVKTIEERQNTKIAALEEIAYKNKWIKRADLLKRAKLFGNSQYGKYLMRVAKEDVKDGSHLIKIKVI